MGSQASYTYCEREVGMQFAIVVFNSTFSWTEANGGKSLSNMPRMI